MKKIYTLLLALAIMASTTIMISNMSLVAFAEEVNVNTHITQNI